MKEENEQYAAWADHFENDNAAPDEEEEVDDEPYHSKDEADDEDEHYMLNESFDFQYG